MLGQWLKEIGAALSTPAPTLDIHDPDAHASHIYGANRRTYIGNRRLAWEFLRRSRVYRQEFSDFLTRWQAIHEAGDQHPERPQFLSEREAFCERWSLWPHRAPPHPDSCKAPMFKDFDVPRTLPPDWVHVGGQTIDLAARHHQQYSPTISVRFFLDHHLGAQIEQFRAWVTSPNFAAWLEEAHGVSLEVINSETRRRDDKYPLYLRILDAQAQGLSDREIASLIHGEGSKPSVTEIGKDISRANALADHGYMGIQRLKHYAAKPRKQAKDR